MRRRAAAAAAAESDDEEDVMFMESAPSDSEGPQDETIRRAIRSDYRVIQTETSRKQTEFVSGQAVQLKKTLENTDSIFENVKHPREATMDAQLMNTLAHLGKEKTQSFTIGLKQYDSIQFVEKLKTFVDGNDIGNDREPCEISQAGWIALGKACSQYLKRSPSLHFMFGSFSRDPPQPRKKPERKLMAKDKDQLAPVAPKQVLSLQEMEKKEATTVEVERIFGILKDVYRKNKNQPVCYFEFVTNPQSFSQTVENMFHTSFLVKDGHCRIQLDDDELPTIEPVDRNENEATVGELVHHQVIMSITKQEWKEIIKTFEIETPLIKTRPRVKPDEGSSSQHSMSAKNLSIQNHLAKKKSKLDEARPSTSSQSGRQQKTIQKNADIETDSD